MRIYVLFFSFFLDTLSFCISVLWPFSDSKHCTSIFFMYMMMLLSFHLSLYVLFFFSLHTHISSCIQSFYFYFTLRWLDEFCLKCFKKTGYQNLLCYKLSSCKVFQEFVLGLDFIVLNKWLWVWWFMTSLILHLFVVVLSWIVKGGDC